MLKTTLVNLEGGGKLFTAFSSSNKERGRRHGTLAQGFYKERQEIQGAFWVKKEVFLQMLDILTAAYFVVFFLCALCG